MGRGNVSQNGHRTDLGFSHSSIKLSDIKSMSNVSEYLNPKSFTFEDFLPNSILKRKALRDSLALTNASSISKSKKQVELEESLFGS